MRDGLKLMLFNHSSPGVGSGEQYELSIALDRRLMERRELYDLESDPGERHDLAAAADGGRERERESRALTELLHRRTRELENEQRDSRYAVSH